MKALSGTRSKSTLSQQWRGILGICTTVKDTCNIKASIRHATCSKDKCATENCANAPVLRRKAKRCTLQFVNVVEAMRHHRGRCVLYLQECFRPAGATAVLSTSRPPKVRSQSSPW